MESTYLYYGKYHADNAGPYQMAVAYFFVIFCCYAISMIRIVMHSGKYFKQGFKFNELNSHQYFDLVFCYWDFSISSKDSVQIKQQSFFKDAKTALDTDQRQQEESERTTFKKIKLYSTRIFAWTLWATTTVFFLLLIGYLYIEGTEGSHEECPSFNFTFEDLSSLAVCYILEYLTTIAITLGNLILPMIFSALSNFEEYDEKSRLMYDLIRNITIRLTGLVVIISGHINSNSCEYWEQDDMVACDNREFANATCARRMCWETSAGIEFYRLTVFDLLTQIFIILTIDLIRSQCINKFGIPKHVLDIVYSQAICWMGLFFSPLISLITFIKLFLLFYIRMAYIKYFCVPSKTFYEASKTTSLLNLFLLVSFGVSFIPMAYILGGMQPSNACGPFSTSSDEDYYTGVVWSLIEDWSSTSGKEFFISISKISVLMTASAAMMLLNYFTFLSYSANKEYNSRIQNQLKDSNEDERKFTAILDQQRQET